jgi:predicted secreted protein
MHNRQSGAAHVPIMFFLILLVMFLGALGFGYVTLTRNGELQKQVAAAKADADVLRNKSFLIEHYIEDIGRAIGKPGKYEGRPGSVSLYNGATLDYPMVMNPAEIKKVMDDACANAGVSVASGLENVLGALVTHTSQQAQRVADISVERDRALTEKGELESKFQTATSTHTQASNTWRQNLEQARAEFTNATADKDRTIGSLQEGLRSKADELTTSKEEATAVEKNLNKEIAKRGMQLSAITAREAMRTPPDVADGKVIAAQAGVPSAFINLGRKDLLKEGTVFRIKNPHSAAVKGYATVTRLEDERAQVELSGLVDAIGDSIRAGDLLFNDLFSPRVTRTIYLMGRFSAPYNKPELTLLLRRLGNKVVDKMAPGVDTVILGNDPINEAGDGFAVVQESDEYKLASDLRVEFAYLNTFADLIKL